MKLKISLENFSKHCFLIRALKFVISAMIVSLFYCYSEFSSFQYSFHVYFSSHLFSAFAHTLERKYMFLLCNGILAFLAKSIINASKFSNDFLIYSPNSSEMSSVHAAEELSQAADIETSAALTEDLPMAMEIPSIDKPQSNSTIFMVRDEVLERGNGHLHAEEEELDSENMIEEEDGNNEYVNEEKNNTISKVRDQDEEELETPLQVNEELSSASTEELNKKIEEFIRKMKEEMRIEAQCQPIPV